MTATLLSRINGFNIVGLLDREEALIDSRQYGIEIISREAADGRKTLLNLGFVKKTGVYRSAGVVTDVRVIM